MTKVICINDTYLFLSRNKSYLTEGKIYDAIEDGLFWSIINDDNNRLSYDKSRFIPLAEWREKQINSLLDD